jgi:hypothetical protein
LMPPSQEISVCSFSRSPYPYYGRDCNSVRGCVVDVVLALYPNFSS